MNIHSRVVEYRPFGQACHHQHHKIDAFATTGAAARRTLDPGFGISQTTRGLSRPGQVWCRSHAESCYRVRVLQATMVIHTDMHTPGNNKRMHGKTRLLPMPSQQRLLGARSRRNQTSRIYSISISMAPRLPRYRSSQSRASRGWRDWQAHHNAWPRPQREVVHLHPQWTICLGYLGTVGEVGEVGAVRLPATT